MSLDGRMAIVTGGGSAEETEAYVAAAQSTFGSVDVLFANAGIEGPFAPIQEFPIDGFDEVIAVNLRGVFLALRSAVVPMLEQGRGSIVITGSLGSERGLPLSAACNVSKRAVVGLARTAAVETGLRVAASVAPVGRMGTAQEIGDVVAFLASDAAGFVNGVAWPVDGGTLAGVGSLSSRY